MWDEQVALPSHVDPIEQGFQTLKAAIHQRLVESLDLSRISDIDRQLLIRHVRQLANEASRDSDQVLSQIDQERLLEELMWEVFGLGPLEPLMRDPAITDVLVNDPHTVYIERDGRMILTDVIFADERHLMRIIQRIVAKLGRRIDAVSPMVDARLPDGSRVNAIVPPLALDGPTLSIRRFGSESLRIQDLLRNESVVPDMVRFLAAVVEARIGCVVAGGTGAGKTTMMNALSSFIPMEERLVTVEDSAELVLQHRHRIRLETRPPNTEGAGEVTQRDLVRNSLRMRPDRILVGEVRGAEVWDMLQAMNTGHEGSMTTIHANSAIDALARLEMMAAMTGYELPVNVVRNYIASGIRLVIHLSRLKGGPRKVVQVSEIAGVKDGQYQLEQIFGFEQTGIDGQGRAVGHFYATGYRPACLKRIASYGIDLPEDLFDEGKRYPDPKTTGKSGETGDKNGAIELVIN
ncbi:MAG: CpaF family protein [Planctomycetales bacterium]|nr:CpaF family protein [Planctomycetales bacterium]